MHATRCGHGNSSACRTKVWKLIPPFLNPLQIIGHPDPCWPHCAFSDTWDGYFQLDKTACARASNLAQNQIATMTPAPQIWKAFPGKPWSVKLNRLDIFSQLHPIKRHITLLKWTWQRPGQHRGDGCGYQKAESGQVIPESHWTSWALHPGDKNDSNCFLLGQQEVWYKSAAFEYFISCQDIWKCSKKKQRIEYYQSHMTQLGSFIMSWGI